MSAPIKGGVPVWPRLLEVTPTENGGTEFRSEMGITHRTYIATHALGFILNDWPCRSITDEQLDAAAGVAVRAADALIKALEVKP